MANETIPQHFLHPVQKYDKDAAFRYKERGQYVSVSHREVLDRVYRAVLGLQALNLAKQDRVALLSENRLEWAVADLAVLSAGGIVVPVYPTLPANQVEYILKDSEARAVFVSDAEQLEKVLERRDRLPALQHVISFDPECDESGVITLEALIARGDMVTDQRPYEEIISTIGKYDWASIIYTSGTTGDPKGAILTHNNFMANTRACLQALDLGPDDTCLSFLPLSHVFERTAGYYVMLTAGVTIAYAESFATVVNNLGEVSPTVVIGVPRLYEKVHAGVLEKVESGSNLKRSLFNWAVKTGQKYVGESLDGRVKFSTTRKLGLANILVFNKLKTKTGGRIRFFISGGAPLSSEINLFFHAAGLPMMEGYGLTETSPVITVNTVKNLKFGTVGKSLPGVEVSIAEDGEILTRSESVMLGYYKKPERTSAAIVDGWFHTGDIGHLDRDGFLVITDRKKDIIVTAGGKNVSPQPIENRIKTSKYVEEAALIGNGRKFVSALIVPVFERLEQFARSLRIPFTSRTELIESPQVIEQIAAEIDELCSPFASFERVKKFGLLEDDFTVESGELTPSMKVKRRVVEEKYKPLIDSLYED
jgi:long-chain acyl-CoA synthetase